MSGHHAICGAAEGPATRKCGVRLTILAGWWNCKTDFLLPVFLVLSLTDPNVDLYQPLSNAQPSQLHHRLFLSAGWWGSSQDHRSQFLRVNLILAVYVLLGLFLCGNPNYIHPKSCHLLLLEYLRRQGGIQFSEFCDINP